MSIVWALSDSSHVMVIGWLSGAIVGLVCLAIAMVALAREPHWAERFPGLRVSLPVFGIVVANVVLVGWTAIGVALGFVHLVLGPPAFSLVVVAAALLGGAAHRLVRAGADGVERIVVWATLGVAIMVFGVAMPAVTGR